MQAQSRSRKRAAPGTPPTANAMMQQQFPDPNTMLDTPFNDEPAATYRESLGPVDSVNPYDNFNTLDPNFYNTSLTAFTNTNTPNPPPTNSSNQLVRRDANHQLATRTPQRNPQWPSFNNTDHHLAENRVFENMDEDDDQDIDTRAAMAKKDAQAKRKQIPPFVQKLSSFLDSSNNTELIRWSDDGNSFIVLDEDEFARTLIPELFKHNNYASFVRQLNMYGFHKKVGLNANSMKAAEKKVKDPNVYWHEYFKRGRPDLLWLIQKPQSKTNSAKRKRNENDKRDSNDSDDDIRRTSPELADTGNLTTKSRPQADLMVSIPQSELHNVRGELQRLQRQQSVISKMISQLKEQNEQFYRQATAFQALHDRHENSINAILTFLATFYNRSLDGQNPQNLVNMFQQQNGQQRGNVVDVGDLSENHTDQMQQVQRYPPKRLLALLPAPMTGTTPASTPGSKQSSMSPSQQRQVNLSMPAPQRHRSSTTPHVKEDSETPNYLDQLPENDDMISLLNNVNASNHASPNPPGGSNFDFNSALDHFQNANGASPLTPQQRDSMLSLIAQQGQPSTSQPGANNALVAPTPPPMPSLDMIQRTQEQLDMLTRLQQEQDSKVADLAGRLQPLSPSGTIPGMGNGGEGDVGNPDFDINAFINSDDNYFNTFPNPASTDVNHPGALETDGPDIDFGNLTDANNWGFDSADALQDADDLFRDLNNGGESGHASDGKENDHDGRGRIVGSVTSESPAQTPGKDSDNVAKSIEVGSASKKRRMNSG